MTADLLGSPATVLPGLVVALVMVLAAVAVARLLAGLRTLPDPGPSPTPSVAVSSPRVSVVVPARDEARTLPALLAALRAQDVRPLEVVVVDDASADDTAAVATAGGAHVVPAGPVPAGWTGKAWACHVGAEVAHGDLLLFLDADTTLAPGALAALLYAHAEHGGLVSVQPHHRVVRAHEQLSAHFNLVAVIASGAFTASPEGSPGGSPGGSPTGAPGARAPMAFGPCLLTTRDDLARAGGHAAVRAEVLDDAALAAAYARAGLPVWCAMGGDLVSMRSYPDGLAQLVAGWTKNIASGAGAAARTASLGTAAWVAGQHAVAMGAAVSLAVTAAGGAGSLLAGSPLLWALAYVGTALHLRALLRRVGDFRWWAWALYPVPLLAFDLVFARSALLTVVRRTVSWRGRPVAVAERVEPAAGTVSTVTPDRGELSAEEVG